MMLQRIFSAIAAAIRSVMGIAWWALTLPLGVAGSLFGSSTTPRAHAAANAAGNALALNTATRMAVAAENAPSQRESDLERRRDREFWRACRALADGRPVPTLHSLDDRMVPGGAEALESWARTPRGRDLVSMVARSTSQSGVARNVLASLPGLLAENETDAEPVAIHWRPRLVWDADAEVGCQLAAA